MIAYRNAGFHEKIMKRPVVLNQKIFRAAGHEQARNGFSGGQ